MKLLLVEDDKRTASFIMKGFRQEGYLVEHAADGEEGLHKALSEPFDAAIVDIMMPKLDGLTLLKRLRAADIDTPVLLLSARSTVGDRVKGLQTGSDDYLVKPFAFSELSARIQALVRRKRPAAESREIEVSDLHLDLIRRKVSRGGREITLQPLELSLLEYLIRNAGRVVSKTMIMENVWDYNFDPQTNVVEARICQLRDKIDKPFEEKLIHTVRGCGYVLEKR